MEKLPQSFYKRKDVAAIAKDLIGKLVLTNINGIKTSGRIVETEAYVAHTDRASHAYKGKRTQRNEHMYANAGTVYVYICYGLHYMLNVVTNDVDVPDVVLIRAVEPVEGIAEMLLRTGKKTVDKTITKGPGNVAKALGITKSFSGQVFGETNIGLYDDGIIVEPATIGTSKRIGIDSAGEDALLPYRFFIKGNKFVSGKPVM